MKMNASFPFSRAFVSPSFPSDARGSGLFISRRFLLVSLRFWFPRLQMRNGKRARFHDSTLTILDGLRLGAVIREPFLILLVCGEYL